MDSLKWENLDQEQIYKKALMLGSTPIPDENGIVNKDCESEYCVITDKNCVLNTRICHKTIDICSSTVSNEKHWFSVNGARLECDDLIIRRADTATTLLGLWDGHKEWLPVYAKSIKIVQPFEDMDSYRKLIRALIMFYYPREDTLSDSYSIHLNKLELTPPKRCDLVLGFIRQCMEKRVKDRLSTMSWFTMHDDGSVNSVITELESISAQLAHMFKETGIIGNASEYALVNAVRRCIDSYIE